MPKETISCEGGYCLKVGWDRSGSAQVGIEVSSLKMSLFEQLLGSDETLMLIGNAAIDAIDVSIGDPADVGSQILDLIDEVTGGYRGIWSNIDRHGCNDLIRFLRRARDQAFGRDE